MSLTLPVTAAGIRVEHHTHNGTPHPGLVDTHHGRPIACLDPHWARVLAAAILAACDNPAPEDTNTNDVPEELLLLALMGAFGTGATSIDGYDGDDVMWLTLALATVIPAIHYATRREVAAVLVNRAKTVTYGQTQAESNAYAQGLADGAALIELGRTA
ncbi:hypothetical protein [Microbispora sp. KK1-11]|uniref:hypothetical protein n=1 Tax=Microbispora sp. KK1-11 TaxID=2053005 RepID=UPI001159A71D|nr:hypothetical protein [Microbispora sp. KK1-11]TQS29148.1 hypothetical protein FLW16_12460 [Microbispora sp. KK1-11]